MKNKESTGHITTLDPGDRTAILKMAHWYAREWDSPVERTLRRLSRQPEGDILFHLVLRVNGKVVGSGSLCKKVNIFRVHEQLKCYSPWAAMIYTHPDYRNRGYATRIVHAIEQRAQDAGYSRIYLYTYSAESLYHRFGWEVIGRLPYRGHPTTVMAKNLQ